MHYTTRGYSVHTVVHTQQHHIVQSMSMEGLHHRHNALLRHNTMGEVDGVPAPTLCPTDEGSEQAQLHHAERTQHAALHALGAQCGMHIMQQHGVVMNAWRCIYLSHTQHGKHSMEHQHQHQHHDGVTW